MTEALTVLQWSRASDCIGRKPVLLIGLIGITLSMLSFGLSRTFWALVIRYGLSYKYLATTKLKLLAISRCLTGLLNGNIGIQVD